MRRFRLATAILLALAPADAAETAAPPNIDVDHPRETSPDDRPNAFSAACDAKANSAAALAKALGARGFLVGQPGRTCLVGDLVVGANQSLDCNGAILQAAPGAQWTSRRPGSTPPSGAAFSTIPAWT